MPSRLEPALEERYGEILDQLRQARVEPSPELSDRVRTLARSEPARPRRRRLFQRRLVLVLAVAVALAAIVAGGVWLSDAAEQQAGEVLGPVAEGEGMRDELQPMPKDSAEESATPPRAGARLQDYRAELTVRVGDADELPRATERAMQVAQSLGGYVVSASYDGGASNSLLVLRVPVARAQEAIQQLSALGELAGQRYSLQDLQATVDGLDSMADRIQERIASLERQLQNPNLTPGERRALRVRIEQAQNELDHVLAQRDSTTAQARSAEIALTLTADVESSAPGIVGRAVDRLGTVWSWVLAVVIVGAPFALLLVLLFLAARKLRRRANDRLLEAH